MAGSEKPLSRISPDALARIRAEAKFWGLDPRLIIAICIAEGDIVKAVSKSVPSVKTRAQAIQITCRTITHAMNDYLGLSAGLSLPGFFEFLARRWAPVGAENDPTGLNQNWLKNVETLFKEL